MNLDQDPGRPSSASRAATRLERLSGALEKLEVLDSPAAAVARVASRFLPPGRARDWASGVPVGHPAHPSVVALPIGSWAAATWLDVRGGDRVTARRLVAFGLVSALPAAATGVNDWLSTAKAEQRVGAVHALANATAVLAYGASWLARRRDRHAVGVLLGLAGFGCAGAAGWLGGHLAYATGVGVDTTAFQAYPPDWTDVAAEADVPAAEPLLVHAAAVPILLARLDTEDGEELVALAARCTHRGGPLTDGELSDGCVTCPWHDSRFDLRDGSVRAGPATRPQPTLEVRTVEGRVQVRRADEPRALRTNPVGP